MMPAPVSVEDREASSAVLSMTADSQLRGGDMEGICDPPNLDGKPLKRTLQN